MNAPSNPQNTPTRLGELFGIDLRSLALFRFALGLVLLAMLCADFCGFRTFYTDAGVLPRALALQSGDAGRLSLYDLNGSSFYAGVLLLIQIAAALMFMLGWRLRIAAAVSFVLFVSLLSRNDLAVATSDQLMACLLFWAMFLPLGARGSVDAALSTDPPPQEPHHLSWASAGLLLQVAIVYFFSALPLLGSDAQTDARGVLLALEQDGSAAGRLLLDFPALIAALVHAIGWLELLGPLLLFSPWFNRPLRLLLTLCFIALQLGLIVFLDLGALPFVALAAWSVFIGGEVWNALARREQRRWPTTPRIYYDGDCGRCRRACRLLREFLLLPRSTLAPAQEFPRARALLEANASWVVIDGNDEAHLKWSAFVVLLRHSPLLRWLWPLARAQTMVAPGNAAYDWLARRRGKSAAVERHVTFEAALPWQRVAGVFVLLMLAWNLAGAQLLPATVQRALAPPLKLLRMDTHWQLTAPLPQASWTVAPAAVAGGGEIDLLRAPPAAPDYNAPVPDSLIRRDPRWRAYLSRLAEPRHAALRAQYGQYLCREWNRRHTPVASFRLVQLIRHALPDGTAQTEQVVLLRQTCDSPR